MGLAGRLAFHAWNNPVPAWWLKLLSRVWRNDTVAVALLLMFAEDCPQFVRKDPDPANWQVLGPEFSRWMKQLKTCTAEEIGGRCRAMEAARRGRQRRG